MFLMACAIISRDRPGRAAQTALAALAPDDQQFTYNDWRVSTSFTPAGSLPPPSLASWSGSPRTCRFWMSDLELAGPRAFWRRPMAPVRVSTSASHSSRPRAIDAADRTERAVLFEAASALDLPFDDSQSTWCCCGTWP